ncbi:MAG: hypothetical protein KKC46_09235 [Proteobacteria bacterium]|nr:hypothetical protein [Pseudomonadota bacterium]
MIFSKIISEFIKSSGVKYSDKLSPELKKIVEENIIKIGDFQKRHPITNIETNSVFSVQFRKSENELNNQRNIGLEKINTEIDLLMLSLKNEVKNKQDSVDMKPQQDETLVDKFIKKLKNHPITSVLLILGIIIIAIGNFADSIDKIMKRLPAKGSYIKPENLPGETGWILVGDIDLKNNKYIRGPLFEIVKSNYTKKDIIPRKGELIQLTSDRNLIIADYKINGLSKIYQPPWQENFLEDDDYTGFKLNKGSIAEVRDVSLGAFPNQPAVVWVRIGIPPN